MSSFMVPVLCRAGAVVVAVGYDLAPQGPYTFVILYIPVDHFCKRKNKKVF